MLNTIGESTVRMTTRADNNLALEHRDIALKKVEKTVRERAVEDPRKSAGSESESGQKTDGYDVDDGKVFYEKYDKDGNVILRMPPEQKPIDERA
ncbi:MAG: hypothetical protein WBY88_16560 [Desulfosarcina sp.]